MNIWIDKTFPEIRIDDQTVSFTRKEYDVFVFLWENKGRICTRDIIYDSVWGMDHYGNERVIDVIISRIRKKVPCVIEAKKGFGYSLKPDP